MAVRFLKVVLLLMLVVENGGRAEAPAGSGESPVGVLETISPTVTGAAAFSEARIEVAFSESMYDPSTRDTSRYTVSGPGKGTLTIRPDTVSGEGPYTLTWNTGEMQGGNSLTVVVTGAQDAVGNPVAPWDCSASFTAMGKAPVFSNLVVMPPQAPVGRKVTLLFTSSEETYAPPVVKINGRNATWISSGSKSVNCVYEYMVTEADTPGMAEITIFAYDPAGNLGTLTRADVLEILEVPLGVPLHLWHIVVGLLSVGLLRSLRRRRSGKYFLTAVLFLMALPVLARDPTVSNVHFVQRPNGIYGSVVDISYDLVAPNGPCAVMVFLSLDGGADGYPYRIMSVTGDVSGVSSGTGKHILWDIYTDYPEQEMQTARIKVTGTECNPAAIQDPGLEQKIRGALGMGAEEPLCQEDLQNLTTLDIDAHYWDELGDEQSIESLSGLQQAVNLRDFRIRGAVNLHDLSPLGEMDQLERLDLPGATGVDDLTPISSLPNLRYLDLQATGVANLAALSSAKSLQELRLGQNAVSDVTPLTALASLQSLDLGDNDIVDVTALSSLANLTWLNLSYNPITTLESFVSGAIFSGAGAGDILLAHGNPFVQVVCDVQIPALETRGVDVTYTPCGEPVAVSACYTPIETTVDAACSTSPSSDPIVAWNWTVTFCLEGWECYVYTNDAGPTLDVSSLCNPEDWAAVKLTIETVSGCHREYSGPFCSGK